MSTTVDTYVRARIDTNTKERAASALEAMGPASVKVVVASPIF